MQNIILKVYKNEEEGWRDADSILDWVPKLSFKTSDLTSPMRELNKANPIPIA